MTFHKLAILLATSLIVCASCSDKKVEKKSQEETSDSEIEATVTDVEADIDNTDNIGDPPADDYIDNDDDYYVTDLDEINALLASLESQEATAPKSSEPAYIDYARFYSDIDKSNNSDWVVCLNLSFSARHMTGQKLTATLHLNHYAKNAIRGEVKQDSYSVTWNVTSNFQDFKYTFRVPYSNFILLDNFYTKFEATVTFTDSAGNEIPTNKQLYDLFEVGPLYNR